MSENKTKNYYYSGVKYIVQIFAVMTSWYLNKSIGWAIFHFLFGGWYFLYKLFTGTYSNGGFTDIIQYYFS